MSSIMQHYAFQERQKRYITNSRIWLLSFTGLTLFTLLGLFIFQTFSQTAFTAAWTAIKAIPPTWFNPALMLVCLILYGWGGYAGFSLSNHWSDLKELLKEKKTLIEERKKLYGF